MPLQFQVCCQEPLAIHNLFVFVDLVSGCKIANTSIQDVYVLKQIYDVKGWLLPATEELHNHSNPHVFRYIYYTRTTTFDNPFIDLPEILMA